jgi:hypothetical protein
LPEINASPGEKQEADEVLFKKDTTEISGIKGLIYNL